MRVNQMFDLAKYRERERESKGRPQSNKVGGQTTNQIITIIYPERERERERENITIKSKLTHSFGGQINTKVRDDNYHYM